MASRKNITLCITGPAGTIRRSLESDAILGSGPGAAVQLADPKASPLHLLLKLDGAGGVKAIDLGGEHGTRRGEAPLLGPTALRSGDELWVGTTKIQVLIEEPEPGEVRVITDAPRLPEQKPAPLPAEPLPEPRLEVRTELPARSAPPPPITAAPNVPRRRAKISAPATLFGAEKHAQRSTKKDTVLQVSLLWGDTVLDLRHFQPGEKVTVGEAHKNPFQVAGLGPAFTLAQAHGLKQIVNIPSSAEVLVRSNGRLQKTEGSKVELGPGDRVQVALDNLSFVLQYVPRPAHMPHGKADPRRYWMLTMTALGLLVAAALIFGWLIKPSERNLASDLSAENAVAVKFLIKKNENARRQKPRQAKKSGAEEGDKKKGEEGKQGEKVAEAREADPSKRGTPVVDPDKQKKIRRDAVMKSGLLGALGKGPVADTVLGPGGQGTGINEKLGGLKAGAGMYTALGVGGAGVRGSGKGGGGNALGIGGLGSKGDGAGTGGSGLELGGSGKGGVEIIPGKTIIEGGLSKEVIARVVRQHEKEIKYCYELELNKNPKLAGKVSMFWIIDGTGAVSEASPQETTLGSPSAEKCMAQKIRRWKFPEPKGGGIVTVTYPWVFKPAAGEE